MFLKIKNQGKWVVFGDVSSLEYDDQPWTVQSATDLYDKFSLNTDRHLILKNKDEIDLNNPSDGFPISIKFMKFESMGKEVELVFDSVAYLCNEEGRTVERIYSYSRD